MKLDQKGSKESGAVKVHQVPEASQDHKVLERKERKVLRESLVFLELWARSDQKVYQDLLALLEHQVIQEYKDSAESQDYQDSKVTMDLLDIKDSKVNMVIKVPGVCQVILVCLVCLVQLERRDPKDQWVFLDTMELKAQEVTKALLDLLDSEVRPVLQEMLVFQVNQGFRDHQESLEILDVLEPKVNKVNLDESLMQLVFPLWESLDLQALLVPQALQDPQDYQALLVQLVCLVKMVLKVTKVTKESQEYQ